MPSKEVQTLQSERERLRREHLAGASAFSVVRGLSDAMDAAVLSIWNRLSGTAGASLVAVGGYGRQQLSPYSDVDLIVLHPKPKSVAGAAKALSYDLWDSGLELGFGIYSPKESLKLAGGRFDVQASYYDARLIGGDPSLFEQWRRGWLKDRGPGSAYFRRQVVLAVGSWRRSGGNAGADLEPNLKEGRGGIRELALLGWLGLLQTSTPPRVHAAAEFLHRVRNHLHFMTGRRTDSLLMQFQPEVASATNPPSLIPDRRLGVADELLRTLYSGCRRISALVDRELFEGRSAALARFEESAQQLAAGQTWPDQMVGEFLSLLNDPETTRAAGLDEELLLSVLPEWRYVWCLPQRNVYHRHAVDVHSLEVVEQSGRLHLSSDDLTRRVAEDANPERNTLLLASLFHDLGKGSEQDHSERGAGLTEQALLRMGIDEPARSDVVWLVKNHLLLAKTATRRDIGDEAVIVELAEKVGSEKRLRLLHLLTVADAVATGLAAWSPWKSTLISRLFIRVNHLLERGELVGGPTTELARAASAEIRQALKEFPEDVVEHHLANMPRAWLLSQAPEALAQQSRLMMNPPAPDEVVLVPVPQREEGVWEVTVVALDRPGLFSKVSGALALHGLNVLGAQLFTREDGVALEVFRVEAIGDEEHRFDRVARDAEKALRGRLSLDVRLAEKRRDYAGRIPKGKREPPEVIVDNRASDFYTVVEVHASDRAGLLYTITRGLADLELDIHLAKVSTYAEDVVDVFYVRDLDGQKVEDPEHVKEIEKTILHRLERDS